MAINIKQAPKECVEQLTGRLPHKVYDLPLERITASDALDGVRFSGWRFLQQDEHGKYYVVEVAVTPSHDCSLKSIESGEAVNAWAFLYDGVQESYLVQQYDYEIACLRIPACEVTAIWLRGDDHSHEIMIPLADVPALLEAGASYSAREFMHIVEYIARERIMQEDMHIAVDDLSIIEGIGSKITELLIQAGIYTFADLAQTDVSRLYQVLYEGGPRYNRADPATWPEQAALARDGNWVVLETLQDELKGGKRDK